MATITLDTLDLADLYLVQTGSGTYNANAVYSLLSGAQVIMTLNQDVTASLDALTQAAIAAAFSTVQAAILTQIGA